MKTLMNLLPNNMRFCQKTPRSLTPAGSEIEPVYGYKVEAGKRVFGIVGEKNVVEEINSYRDQTDFSLIMKSLNPDVSDFDSFSNLIDNVIPSLGTIQDMVSYDAILRDEFAQLPLKVKNNYGNDYERFARDLVGGGFLSYIEKEYRSDEGAQNSSDGRVASDNSVEESAGKSGNIPTGRDRDGINDLDRQFEEFKRKISESRKEGE